MLSRLFAVPFATASCIRVLLVLVLSILAYHLSMENYLVFHTLTEGFTIIVSVTIALFVFHSYAHLTNMFIVILGISYGFTGLFDILHMLAYKGMGVFPDSEANLPTQMWLIARGFDAIGMLIAGLYLEKAARVNIKWIVAAYGGAAILMLAAVFYWGVFPKCFSEEYGLTAFKIYSEYILCAILIGSVFLLKRHQAQFQPQAYRFLLFFFLASVCTELTMTVYIEIDGLMNALGHLFKVAAYFFLYRATVEASLKNPYAALAATNASLREEILLREKFQADFRQLELEMTRFDRLSIVGELAASIGHEVRNPMTIVRGYLQMFQRREVFAKYLEQINTMIEELDRANTIITEFLSLAKNRTVQIKPGNLNDVILSLLPLLEADAFRRGHEIQTELGCIPENDFDEKEIRQLVLNLVRNAFEAMEQGGKVIIRTYPEDSKLVLAVQDTGPGIPPEIKEKLGTPFVTTKDTGTGLGLPVCFRIAKEHGADLKVDTSAAGTTFSLYFLPPALILAKQASEAVTAQA